MDKQKFRFGIDRKPKWFTERVKLMQIEYIYDKRKIIGCRYYKQNKEIIKLKGQMIYLDEIL